MKFSVLMSVYEKENKNNLEESIKSIINQTIKADEILIIKDGRLPEELDKVIEKYKKENNTIRTYQIENNVGLGMALRKGVILCQNDYIARMDSDDISLKDRFEKQINYLKEHSEIEVLGGYIQEFDETMTKKTVIKKVPLRMNEIKQTIKKQNPFNHGTVIFKKNSVINVGNYRDYKIEDYDLWIRMCEQDKKMANLDEVLVNYRTSNQMYNRRSSKKWLKGIIQIEKELLKRGLINRREYIINIIERSILVMIPVKIKQIIYPRIIRKLV